MSIYWQICRLDRILVLGRRLLVTYKACPIYGIACGVTRKLLVIVYGFFLAQLSHLDRPVLLSGRTMRQPVTLALPHAAQRIDTMSCIGLRKTVVAMLPTVEILKVRKVGATYVIGSKIHLLGEVLLKGIFFMLKHCL